jgi:hypothetical protein
MRSRSRHSPGVLAALRLAVLAFLGVLFGEPEDLNPLEGE